MRPFCGRVAVRDRDCNRAHRHAGQTITPAGPGLPGAPPGIPQESSRVWWRLTRARPAMLEPGRSLNEAQAAGAGALRECVNPGADRPVSLFPRKGVQHDVRTELSTLA
jgi:hypothetical protein